MNLILKVYVPPLFFLVSPGNVHHAHRAKFGVRSTSDSDHTKYGIENVFPMTAAGDAIVDDKGKYAIAGCFRTVTDIFSYKGCPLSIPVGTMVYLAPIGTFVADGSCGPLISDVIPCRHRQPSGWT